MPSACFGTDDQSKQELQEAEERGKMLLLSQLQQEQVILQSSLQQVFFQSPQQERFEAKQRGIVICAGGNKLLINVFVSVKVGIQSLGLSIFLLVVVAHQQDCFSYTRSDYPCTHRSSLAASILSLTGNLIAYDAVHLWNVEGHTEVLAGLT